MGRARITRRDSRRKDIETWVLAGARTKSRSSSKVSGSSFTRLSGFQECGTDWGAITEALHCEEFSHRTVEHVIAFYEQNRDLLSQAELTDDDLEQLKASMKQFYKMKNKPRMVDRVEHHDRN
mmetsp:Transcript_42258/g.64788  ORF Transcript_42258/g.64788 Transcript_42258/m.64788 type:complete len:123 (+) Transcript_42258:211-579(+)